MAEPCCWQNDPALPGKRADTDKGTKAAGWPPLEHVLIPVKLQIPDEALMALTGVENITAMRYHTLGMMTQRRYMYHDHSGNARAGHSA